MRDLVLAKDLGGWFCKKAHRRGRLCHTSTGANAVWMPAKDFGCWFCKKAGEETSTPTAAKAALVGDLGLCTHEYRRESEASHRK
jgi:hypothetical protein